MFLLLKGIVLFLMFTKFVNPLFLFSSGKLPKGLESSFNVTLVVDQSEGDRIAQNFYDKHPRVSIDLEGYNLGLNGIITLCQVAVSSDHVYLFDILQCPYFLKRGVLRKILQSEKITKVWWHLAETQ